MRWSKMYTDNFEKGKQHNTSFIRMGQNNLQEAFLYYMHIFAPFYHDFRCTV